MVPIVALIGRQNVGKSTLFNRLTRTRDALIADFPGLTRDRKYGRAEVEGREFICIDTGGIDRIKEDDVEIRMTEQSLLAIEEADVVLFIVDARVGLMPADSTIAKHLRSREKLTFLVANKTDGIDIKQAINEFWSLGVGEIYPIAASHGYGTTRLMKSVLLPFIEENEANQLKKLGKKVINHHFEGEKEDKLGDNFNPRDLPIKLAIVGYPNVGKSTIINRILGEERMVVCNMPGTTRDSIYIPIKRNKRSYLIIDTAGVRKRSKITGIIEKLSVIKTLKAIEEANVVLLVIDAHKGVSGQDLSLLDFILNNGRSLVIIVNKWDGLSNERKEQIKETLNYRLSFINFVRVHFISALYWSGVDNIFTSVHEAYDSSTRRHNTAMLTRIMNMAVGDHQPPLVHGRRVKLKYAHAGGHNPPIVVIHGNQVKDLMDSYKRYLINYFRKSLNIMGTPIYLQFKEGNNPFTNKRNTLTINHIGKRFLKNKKK